MQSCIPFLECKWLLFVGLAMHCSDEEQLCSEHRVTVNIHILKHVQPLASTPQYTILPLGGATASSRRQVCYRDSRERLCPSMKSIVSWSSALWSNKTKKEKLPVLIWTVRLLWGEHRAAFQFCNYRSDILELQISVRFLSLDLKKHAAALNDFTKILFKSKKTRLKWHEFLQHIIPGSKRANLASLCSDASHF